MVYKNVNDFVFESVIENPTNGVEEITPENGESATLIGAEVSFQRQLDFLLGFLKGLGVYLNYTYVYSEADFAAQRDGFEDIGLPGACPHMFNGSLSYEDDKLSLRASVNYSADYIDELGSSSFNDRYYDSQFFLDLNASYAITPQLRVYAELNNVTNQPLRYYQGVRERTMQIEYYDMRFNFGIKYDLFKK